MITGRSILAAGGGDDEYTTLAGMKTDELQWLKDNDGPHNASRRRIYARMVREGRLT